MTKAKSPMTSKVPTTAAEADALLEGAGIATMDEGLVREPKAPTIKPDPEKLSKHVESVRGSVKFEIREGTIPVRQNNAGSNPGVYVGGDTLHGNQVELTVRLGGAK